jgi:signal transduction histidine kinase
LYDSFKLRYRMQSHRNHRASFFRQALLIATPLMILSTVALYSLRQDKASIDLDARDRARLLAGDLAGRWRESVREDLEEFLADWYLDKFVPVALAWPEGSGISRVQDVAEVRIQAQRAHANPLLKNLPQLRGDLVNGRIRMPADYPRFPAPPEWTGNLTLAQEQTLRAAEQAFLQQRDPMAARKALAAMREARVPEAASASAEFELLLLEAGRGGEPDLSRRLTDLARKYPGACTEAGTPLADLALIQALRRSAAGPLPDSLRQELFHRVIGHPSFLTPELIAAAKGVPPDPQNLQSAGILEDVWLSQERTRTLLQPVLKIPWDPYAKTTETWVETENQAFLVQRETRFAYGYEKSVQQPPGTAFAVTLIPGRLLEQAFLNAFAKTGAQFPSYLTASVQIGGKRWPVAPGPTLPGNRPEDVTLAEASSALIAAPALPGYLWKNARDRDLEYLAPPERVTMRFSVILELARPDLLYARYRQHMWIAVGLVLLASAAAGLGLAGAWRAFRRQQQLAEMTTNFISSVSHELRAPLASVRLMAESLDQDRITDHDRRKSYFRLIVQECRRLSSLVENVLDFSRIHQGRKRYEFEPIALATLIRQTVRLMEPGAEERQVTLALSEPESGSEELQPTWDGQAVQQALVNLIDNAIKHAPPGQTVKIAYAAVPQKGDGVPGSIHLTVEDPGPGIPAEEQERIFEPFYRRGTELRRETKGIGIGLSIVKHVAEAHGGRAYVRSAVGRGSLFTLELPLGLKPQSNADE